MRLLPLKTAVVVLFALAVLAAPTSDGSWRELGPHFSGRVSAIAVRNANEMWAASPGGGVWKSTNGGANWSWAGNYGISDYIALDLAFDRQHPERLYLRTWNGFLVSTDGGAHWQQLGASSLFAGASGLLTLLLRDHSVLTAVLGQEGVSPVEVIVIDSGSTDGTLDIAARYQVTVHRIARTAFTFGSALNLGARLAQAPVCVHLSGHSPPTSRRWLESLLESLVVFG